VANQQFTDTLIVEVGDKALRPELATLLTDAWVEDSRALPDMFVLRFRDPARTVLERSGIAIGTAVTVKVQAGDAPGPQELVSGEVTSLTLDLDGAGTVTEVRGYDPSHRLFRGRTVAAYADMSVADVVRKVAQRANLQVAEVTATSEPPQDSQIMQAGESDWDFLSRLADATGSELSVVDKKLHFVGPTDAAGAPGATAKAHRHPLVLEAGQNLLALRAGITAAEQVDHVEVRGWDYLAKQAVTATAPARTTHAELADITPQQLAGRFGAPALLATDVPYRTRAQAQAAASAIAAEVAAGFAELDGLARGNPALRAGTPVALTGVGRPFEGRYTLSTTRHVFREDTGYTVAFTVSGRAERSLHGLATGGGARRVPGGGVAPAVVTDVRDPRGMGRVKVSLPWLSDDYTSSWARTVQIGAGADRGALILPEVGDEVLVGFEQGDPASPYVLGGLYNGRDAPAHSDTEVVDGNSGQVNARRLVSRTGHVLELVESAGGSDGVRIATGDGACVLTLDKQGTRVTVHSDGTVRIEGSRGVAVDAGTGALELTGTDVKITATSGVTVRGAQVSVQGTGTAELKSSGVLTVQGSLVKIN
jgi:uncharacterized protein involved in type VI secretion and phage assembly